MSNYSSMYLIPKTLYETYLNQGDRTVREAISSINIRQLNNISDNVRATIQANDITKTSTPRLPGAIPPPSGGGEGNLSVGGVSLGPNNFGQTPSSDVKGENFGQIRSEGGASESPAPSRNVELPPPPSTLLPPPSHNAELSSSPPSHNSEPPPPASPSKTSFPSTGVQTHAVLEDKATVTTPEQQNVATETENDNAATSKDAQTDVPHTHEVDAPTVQESIWDYARRKRPRNAVMGGLSNVLETASTNSPPTKIMTTVGSQATADPIATEEREMQTDPMAPPTPTVREVEKIVYVEKPVVQTKIVRVEKRRKPGTTVDTQTDPMVPPTPEVREKIVYREKPPVVQTKIVHVEKRRKPVATVDTQTDPESPRPLLPTPPPIVRTLEKIVYVDKPRRIVKYMRRPVSGSAVETQTDPEPTHEIVQPGRPEAGTQTEGDGALVPMRPSWDFSRHRRLGLGQRSMPALRIEESPAVKAIKTGRQPLAITYKPSPKKFTPKFSPKKSVRMKKPPAKYSPSPIKKRAGGSKKSVSSARAPPSLSDDDAPMPGPSGMQQLPPPPQSQKQPKPRRGHQRKKTLAMTEYEQNRAADKKAAEWRGKATQPKWLPSSGVGRKGKGGGKRGEDDVEIDSSKKKPRRK
jgi:hypothetical protein